MAHPSCLPLLTPPASLCLLRLSAIGDVCHAVAVVQALRCYWPETRISWVIGKNEAALLAGLEGVELIPYDKRSGWRGWWALRRQLADRRFDVLLQMQVALRASWLSLAIGAQLRLGFERRRAREGQWLFTNAYALPARGEHVIDGFAAFIETLGVPWPGPSWQMPLSNELRQWAEQQGDGRPLLIISPSASKAERNWTVAGYAVLAEHAAAHGYQVMLCGGPSASDAQLAAAIVGQCRVALDNRVGQTSLKQLLALLACARLVVGPDSGPLHMAATVGTPALGLYAHSNPARTGPLAAGSQVVSVYEQVLAETTGRESSGHRWGRRNRGQQLMQRIDVAAVLAAFDAMVATAPAQAECSCG